MGCAYALQTLNEPALGPTFFWLLGLSRWVASPSSGPAPCHRAGEGQPAPSQRWVPNPQASAWPPGPHSLPLQGCARWGKDPANGTQASGPTALGAGPRAEAESPPRPESARLSGVPGRLFLANEASTAGPWRTGPRWGAAGKGGEDGQWPPLRVGGRAGSSVAEQRPPRGVGSPAPPPRWCPRRALRARRYSPPGAAGRAAGRWSTWPREAAAAAAAAPGH